MPLSQLLLAYERWTATLIVIHTVVTYPIQHYMTTADVNTQNIHQQDWHSGKV